MKPSEDWLESQQLEGVPLKSIKNRRSVPLHSSISIIDLSNSLKLKRGIKHSLLADLHCFVLLFKLYTKRSLVLGVSKK